MVSEATCGKLCIVYLATVILDIWMHGYNMNNTYGLCLKYLPKIWEGSHWKRQGLGTVLNVARCNSDDDLKRMVNTVRIYLLSGQWVKDKDLSTRECHVELNYVAVDNKSVTRFRFPIPYTYQDPMSSRVTKVKML